MLIVPTLPSTRVLRNLTRQHLQATNDISRQMLSDAMMGLFIEPILAVMAAIYGNGCYEKSSRNLLSVGGSSGTAMLLGLLAGAAFVENRQLQMTPNSPEPIFFASQ